MTITRDFVSCDRYRFDFGACSIEKGWAQVDTSQDASYFGTWANPEKLEIFTYCEGDLTHQKAADVAEFVAEIRSIKKWNEEYGHRFLGIDPGLDGAIAERFQSIGLGDLLH